MFGSAAVWQLVSTMPCTVYKWEVPHVLTLLPVFHMLCVANRGYPSWQSAVDAWYNEVRTLQDPSNAATYAFEFFRLSS
jgi:hypothetical protein